MIFEGDRFDVASRSAQSSLKKNTRRLFEKKQLKNESEEQLEIKLGLISVQRIRWPSDDTNMM